MASRRFGLSALDGHEYSDPNWERPVGARQDFAEYTSVA